MIDQFNKSAIADFFNYNDPSIAEWADNVYEKLRQTGELAGYIPRDRVIKECFDVVDGSDTAPIMVENNKFTFGQAYCGSLLTTSKTEDMGNVYQVEFEVMVNEVVFGDISLFDGNLVITSDGTLSFYNIGFDNLIIDLGVLYRVKLIRNYTEVTLYMNDVFIDKKNINTDANTTFTVLYGSLPSTPPQNVVYSLMVNSTNPTSGTLISVDTPDVNNNTHGYTSFSRQYIDGQEVVLTAPTKPYLDSVNAFQRWVLNGVNQPLYLNNVTVLMDGNNVLEAVYGVVTPVYGSITINKAMDNLTEPAVIFKFNVEGTILPLYSETLGCRAGQSVVFPNLPADTYTITPIEPGGYELVSISTTTCTIATGENFVVNAVNRATV